MKYWKNLHGEEIGYINDQIGIYNKLQSTDTLQEVY